MRKIGVLGAGSWGTALSKVLCENGHEVKVWLRDEAQCNDIRTTKINKKYLPNVILPDNLHFTTDIEEALGNSEIILNAIPTQKIREVFEMIPKNLVTNKIIICNTFRSITRRGSGTSITNSDNCCFRQ